MNRTDRYIGNYPKELTINPFGDYDTLELLYKDEDGVITKTWSLNSSMGAPKIVLNEKDKMTALENVFLLAAARCPAESHAK